MELALLVYLVGFIEKLNSLLGDLAFISPIALALSLATYVLNISTSRPSEGEMRLINASKKVSILALTVLITSVTLRTFIPSKDTFTMMIGAYAGQKVIEHPKTSELFDKSLKAIETQLDVLIAPPKETKKEEGK